MKKQYLYESLIEYSENGRYGFHMPGHKRNESFLKGLDPFDVDITEIEGFDNLHNAEGIIKESMEQVSEILGTKRSWYLVNGSTSGILAAISTVTNIGDRIIIGRNCHKAVYNAVEIRNLKVEYLYPTYIEEVGVNGSYNIKDLIELFDKTEDVKAVVITSPTYEGVVSDIKEIAKIVHKNGAILIVDEAHGAHFFASEKFPESAYKLGADLVIESTHKTLSALTQTAILHCIGDKVDVKKVEKYLGIYQSSSPSYLFMASIEKAILDAKQHSEEKTEKLLIKLSKFRANVNNLNNFYCIESVLRNKKEVFGVDDTKVIIGIKSQSINGSKLTEILRKEYNFEMEMTSINYVLAMTSMADDLKKIDELYEALKCIDERLKSGQKREAIKIEGLKNVAKIAAYEASECEKNEVLLDEAKDKVAGEYIYLYPPGIPLLVPGELISENIIQAIKRYQSEGLNVCGLCDKNKIMILD